MAGRLVQWVIESLDLEERERLAWDELNREPRHWDDVVPGTLTFHCCSLHIFEGPDEATLRRRYDIHL